MKKYLLLAFVFSAVLIMPNFHSASAATVAELQAQISALFEQIKKLQTELKQVQKQPVEWCYDFKTNLKIGDFDEDETGNIYTLHEVLIKEGFSFEYKTTLGGLRSFDEETASAVVGFQQKYKEEILTPLSLKYGTGFVGQATRAKLNKLYGCGERIRPPIMPPEVKPISYPVLYIFPTILVQDSVYNFETKITNAVPNSNIYFYLQRPDGSMKYEKYYIQDFDDELTFSMTDAGGNRSLSLKRQITKGQTGIYKAWVVIADKKSNVVNFNVLSPQITQTSQPPVIHGVSGPTALKINETGTWEVEASDPENGILTYSVQWGDEAVSATEQTSSAAIPKVSQQATFTHSYSKPGIYYSTFTVTDNQNQSAKTGISVNVGEIVVERGSMKISVYDNNSQTILYNAKVSVYDEKGGYIGTKYTSGGAAGFYDLPVGTYTALAEADGYESAKKEFKIIANEGLYLTIYLTKQAVAPSITVLSPNGGEFLTKGEWQNISWKGGPRDLKNEIRLIDANILPTPSPLYSYAYYLLKEKTDLTGAADGYSWVWTVGDTKFTKQVIPAGKYIMRIIASDGNYDDSDKPFSIQASSDSDNSPDYLKNPISFPITQDKYPDLFKAGVGKGIYIGSSPTYHAIYGLEPNPAIPKTTSDNYSTVYDYCDSTSLIEAYLTSEGKLGAHGISTPAGLKCEKGAFISVAQTATITVLSPNGGENWFKGKSYTINWTSNGVNKVIIRLSSINGAKKDVILENNPDNYIFTVPTDFDGGPAKLYVMNQENQNVLGMPQNGYLGIVAEKDFSVASVDGFKTSYTSGEKLNLTIKAVEKDGSPASTEEGFNVILAVHDKNSSQYIPQNNGVNGSNATYFLNGYWSFNANETLNAGKYYMIIYLYCSRDNSICEKRYGRAAQIEKRLDFEVISATVPASLITVYSPNGGEKWEIGKSYDVKWRNGSGKNTRIELIKGDKFIEYRGPFPADKTTYSWLLSDSLQSGSDYKILVTSLNSAGLADYLYQDRSDAPFSIVSFTPFITGAGGKATGNFEMDAGGSATIYGNNLAGNDLSTTKVFIGGIQAPVLMANDNTLSITVPSSLVAGQTYDMYVSNEKGVSNVVKIKILSNLTIFSITVLSPNGGENFNWSSVNSIKWSYSNLQQVSLGLYKNNSFFNWIATNITLPSVANAAGSYDWTPSQTISEANITGTDTFKIYILGYKTDGGTIFDFSDAPFSIVSSLTAPKLNVSVSALPVAQTVIGGSQNFEFAKFMFDATQSSEDVRITSMQIRREISLKGGINTRNLHLYNETTVLDAGINSAWDSNNVVSLDFIMDPGRPFIISKGTSKIIVLRADIAIDAQAGTSERFGLADNAKIIGVGVTSGQAVNTTIQANPGNWMTVISAGSYSVSLDAESPAYKIVAANTTNVELARLKFTAQNEDVDIKRVAFQLSGPESNTPNDLAGKEITLYDGAVSIGIAIFATGDFAVSILLNNFKIPKNSSKTMLVKGDIATINSVTGPIVASGDLLKVDYDGDNNGLNGNYGIGASSGINITPSSSDTSSAGVRIMKAYPTVAKINLSIMEKILQNGLGKTLYKFSITAPLTGSIGLYQLTFKIQTDGLGITNFNVFAFSDSDFSLPVSGIGSDGRMLKQGLNQSLPTDEFHIQPRTAEGLLTTLQIPAGTTVYFIVKTDISSALGSASIYLNGDALLPSSTVMADTVTIQNDTDSRKNFIWSPNSVGVSSRHNQDWTNGYAIPGLPASGLTSEIFSPLAALNKPTSLNQMANTLESAKAILEQMLKSLK